MRKHGLTAFFVLIIFVVNFTFETGFVFGANRGFALSYNRNDSTEYVRAVDIYLSGVDDFYSAKLKFNAQGAEKAEFTPGITEDDSGYEIVAIPAEFDGTTVSVCIQTDGTITPSGGKIYFGRVTLTVPSPETIINADIVDIQIIASDGTELSFTAVERAAGSIDIPPYVLPSTPTPTETPSVAPTGTPRATAPVTAAPAQTTAPAIPEETVSVTFTPQPDTASESPAAPTPEVSAPPETESDAPATVEPDADCASIILGNIFNEVPESYGKFGNLIGYNVTAVISGESAVYGEDFKAFYKGAELTEEEFAYYMDGEDGSVTSDGLLDLLTDISFEGEYSLALTATAKYEKGDDTANTVSLDRATVKITLPDGADDLKSSVTVNGKNLTGDTLVSNIGEQLDINLNCARYTSLVWDISGTEDSAYQTNADKSVVITGTFATVNLQAKLYGVTLKIYTPDHGSVTVSKDGTALSDGATVYRGDTLTPQWTAAGSYKLYGWNVTGVSKSGTGYKVNDDADTVSFAAMVTAVTSGGGGGGGGGSSSSSSSKSAAATPSVSPAASASPDPTDSPSATPTVTPTVAPSSSPAPRFEDLASVPWAAEAIEQLARLGLVNGRSDTIFAPEDNVSRAEFVKMVCSVFGIESQLETEVNFEDISLDDWYYGYVAAGVKYGITNGVTDTEFAPDALISREQMAAMLHRAITAQKITSPYAEYSEEKAFADYDEISEYAKEAVEKLASAGIINGMTDTTFAPKSFATRAQAAIMLYRLYVKIT